MPAESPSRRDFLRTTGTAMSAALLTANLPSLTSARVWAAEVARSGEHPQFDFLTDEEAAVLEAISARIVPTDELPGAREAGVVYFADRTMGDSLAAIGSTFRRGYPSFVALVRDRHPDAASFADLSDREQDALLREVENGAFFQSIRLVTVFGMFSDPVHGGNRDGVGWELIGFEDQHVWSPPFGHYDRGHHEGGE